MLSFMQPRRSRERAGRSPAPMGNASASNVVDIQGCMPFFL